MKGLVSVIVSTYNKPDYLALTLRSLRAQTDRDFEVIVADDGSDERTKCVVKCEEKFSDLTTKHVWHPKQGFRLAAIRNRAVEAASGQYLIFMDGDCLAPPDFVATHRRLAEAGWHVIGQRVLLSRSFTHRILQKFSDDQDEIPFIKWNLAYFALHYCGRSVNRLLPFVSCLSAHIGPMLLDHGIVYAAAIGPCGRPTTNLSLALTKPLRDGGQRTLILRFVSTTVE